MKDVYVSLKQWYHWLNGRSLPSIDNVYALSELFSVPIDKIICGNRGYQPEQRSIYYRLFKYVMCNRVARSLFDIGDQAGTCAQLFFVKERSYGFEQEFYVFLFSIIEQLFAI